MDSIITSKNLNFKDILQYPDISIEKGKVTFLSGPSGCGKSTLLKLYNGTLSPNAGEILYRGEEITSYDKIGLRREILLVKQVPYLFKGTVYENFKEFHNYQESECPTPIEIEKLLNLCSIPVALDAVCDTMSGGECQRIFLSISLSLKPKVLMLDEPTSALNKELAFEVMQKIIEYVKKYKITLLVISHDMELQECFAENVIELRRTS